MSNSFYLIRSCPSAATDSCSSSSSSSFFPSSRSFTANGRRRNQNKILFEEIDLHSRMGRNWLNGSTTQRAIASEDESHIDLEDEIYEFMEKSGKPNHFPSKEDLIKAGRRDLVQAIAKNGGWLAYGWDLNHDDEGSEKILSLGIKEDDDARLSLGYFDGRIHEQENRSNSIASLKSEDENGVDGIWKRLENSNLGIEEEEENSEFSLGFLNGKIHKLEDKSPEALLKSEDRSGVDGILRRLENERFSSYFDPSSDSETKKSRRMSSKKKDQNHSVKEFFGKTKANGVKSFNSGIHQISFPQSTKNLNSDELAHHHTKSRLLSLEYELSSVLGYLRSQDDTSLPLKALNGKRSSIREMHKMVDAQEFIETEIMNVQGKLRSTKAKIAALKGRMALQIIESQKIVEEKQKRIDAAQRAVNLLRTVYVAWPNLASEVLLAGSFDGWSSQVYPESLLSRRMTRGGLQVLVKWQNLPELEATWEDASALEKQFPEFQIADNLHLQQGSIDTDLPKVYQRRLGAVTNGLEKRLFNNPEDVFSEDSAHSSMGSTNEQTRLFVEEAVAASESGAVGDPNRMGEISDATSHNLG